MIPQPESIGQAVLLGVACFFVALFSVFGRQIGRHLAVDFALSFRLLSEWLVRLAVLRLPNPVRARYLDEWLGELDALRTETEIAPALSLLGYAVPLLFRAQWISRELRPVPQPAPPPGSRRIGSAHFARLARRRLLRARIRRKLAFLSLAALALGVPGANAGLARLQRFVGSEIPIVQPSRGIEASEVSRELWEERAAIHSFRLSTPKN